MQTIVFYDEVCPKPYNPSTLTTEGLGGTEATVIRVAQGLSTTQRYDVNVWQYNAPPQDEGHGNPYYTYVHENHGLKPSYVVCLRNPYSLIKAREAFPEAKLILWLHDTATPALGQALKVMEDLAHAVICVSESHRIQTVETLKSHGYNGKFPVKVIYNPIDDDLKPDSTEVDRNKLIFTSSPHKGLTHALTVFSCLLRFNPDFRYYIANPGYVPSPETKDPNVVSLGTLPYSQGIKHVRESLCVLHPNVVFPETFGLVYAEANAVGTPCITHYFGSAREVTDHPAEVLDCRDVTQVVDRVMAWHSGERPIVRANPRFRTSVVVQEWCRLLR